MSRRDARALSGPAGWPGGPDLPALAAGEAVHLVGIGGAGMSGLARALLARGLTVSGSDRGDGPWRDELEALGARVRIGHEAEHVPPGCVLLVRSPAVPDDNPEVAAARARGIPVTKRAALLGALSAQPGLRCVAVAGTHGKTTTSAWIAFLLSRAGRDPSWFVGAAIPGLGPNARAGLGELLVLEADEYDRTFLAFRPELAVVTTLEHDHPDLFESERAVLAAFADFVARVTPEGRLIAWRGAHGVAALAGACPAPTLSYAVEGETPPAGAPPPDWYAAAPRHEAGRQSFELRQGARSHGRFEISLPGPHNLANAVAALAACAALGLDPSDLREALAAFRGVERRFQVLGRAGGATLVDDYAHHPTEVAAALAAARQTLDDDAAGGRVVAILQPHTYSRVAAMAADFARALDAADIAIITPTYGAREPRSEAGESARIAERMEGALLAADLDEAARLAADRAEPGDLLLFLGAGDVPRASRVALRRLRENDARALLAAGRDAGLGGEPLEGSTLAAVTSLRLGGPADLLLRVRALDDLAGWWRLARARGMPARVLGRGSNVLAPDAGLPGLVLVNRCEAWELEEEGDESALLVAESGASLAALAQQLARRGWSGLETAVGIPGSIGAAALTNAGAHGWEMADDLCWAEVLEPDGEVRRWRAEEMAFRYRGSALKGNPDRLVLRVALRLRALAPERIQERIAGYRARRRASQPSEPSVGSMFKNPPGDYAGRLIEAAGLKGHRVGGAMISPKHANFFVNDGSASAEDVERLVALARRRVRERFGVELQLEIERLEEAP